MRKILNILLLLSPLFHHFALASEVKIQCIGPEPENAKSFFVFLHGAGLEGLHSKNVGILREIAKSKKVRFAIPIATWECTSEEYKGKPCWMTGKFDDNAYKPAMRAVEEAAESCFRNRNYGILGFSNGAAFVNSIIFNCVPNKFTALISIGLGYRISPQDRQGLRGCNPQLRMMSGKTDKNLESIKKTFQVLKNREADVTFDEFEGGHELIAQPLFNFFD